MESWRRFLTESHQMSMEDFNDVGNALRDPEKVKEIHRLLIEMFPKQKDRQQLLEQFHV